MASGLSLTQYFILYPDSSQSYIDSHDLKCFVAASCRSLPRRRSFQDSQFAAGPWYTGHQQRSVIGSDSYNSDFLLGFGFDNCF